MGSAAAAPQPHGAGVARVSKAAGHILGPWATHCKAPDTGKWPGLREAGRRERREGGPGPGKGKGKGRGREGRNENLSEEQV